jgi:chaperonin GroES
LVKRSKRQKTRGGILLPETAQEKPKEGEVIAVGPGKTDEDGKLQPMMVKAGDRVLFAAYAGMEVKMPSEEEDELLVMAEDEILGILR